MDATKKYGEKYSALRAAAAARQRQRSSASSSTTIGISSSSGDTSQQKLPQGPSSSGLWGQAFRTSASGSGAGEEENINNGSPVKGLDGGKQQQQRPMTSASSSSLPPRNSMTGGTNRNALATPSTGALAFGKTLTQTKAKNLPTQSNDAPSASAGKYQYATPSNGGNLGMMVTTEENDGQEDDYGSSPVPPKTPLTMMKSVMDSISRDRSEIEGATSRRGVLFEDDSVGVGGVEVIGKAAESAAAEGGRRSNVDFEVDNVESSYETARQLDGTFNASIDAAENDSGEVYQQRQYSNPRSLPYGSEIVLRFCHSRILSSVSVLPKSVRSSSSGAINGNSSANRRCIVANEANGLMGGIDRNGENRFAIVKVADDGTSSPLGEGGEGGVNGNDDPSHNYLCYGDKITLRSGVMKRVLGVQKVEVASGPGENGEGNNDTASYKLEVGTFRRESRFPQANTWTVSRGGPNAPIVQLGSSSYTALPSTGEDEGKSRIPVYSGDPIVLRNEWTGGLLSLGGEEPRLQSTLSSSVDDGTIAPGWSLKVITSSYQMNDDLGGGANTDDDRPLIEYLHGHNKVRPRKTETFQILRGDLPNCPRWVYPSVTGGVEGSGGSGGDRIYLDGTYLSYPNRHELEDEMEAEIFPESAECAAAASARGGDEELPSLSELNVDAQEKILMDEIIGAMMGLEGRFLRFQQMEDEAEGEDEEPHIITGFGLASSSISGTNKIDSSLENIVMKILPLCTNYVYVNQYVSSTLVNYECGIVARTLCEAMNELLVEYLAFVTNLDYLSHSPAGGFARGGDGGPQPLTVSMVYVHSQPSIRTMAILAQVVSTVRNKKGGDLLNALHSLLSINYSGDEKGSQLIKHLLTKSAAPYANMLTSWLRNGKVHDPYGEFMIEVTNRAFRENRIATSNSSNKQGMEWTDWCREREENVLRSLHDSNEDVMLPLGDEAGLGVDGSRATSNMTALHKAHATGKYWRAIHCCQPDGVTATAATTAASEMGSPLINSKQQRKKEKAKESEVEEAKVLLNPLKLSRHIDQAYHEASDTLLHLLLDEYGLLSSLRFMKKYFLLDQGDFFVDFLDGAEDELLKDLPNVLQGRVQNWLTASIARTSSDETSSHALASALRCTFQNKSLRDTLDDLGKRKQHRKSSSKSSRQQNKVLSGFEAIAFEFKSVPFPTSIVLSTNQLRIYQLIFRLIFFAKYVERRLVSMWSDHQLLKSMMTTSALRTACGPTFSLRRRMLHFIQNFVYYLKFDVIEPNWRELESKLDATREYCCNNEEVDENNKDVMNDGVQYFPRTIDDLLHQHNEFLIRISNQCLLTNYDLIDRASKIMTTCLLFSTQIKRFMETTRVHELHERTKYERTKLRYGGGEKKKNDNNDPQMNFRTSREERTKRTSERILRELSTETYQHMITRFDEVFTAHLGEFMKNLDDNDGDYNGRTMHLANLSMQLDYNGFVSSTM